MAAVSNEFIQVLVLVAKDKNEAAPADWLRIYQKEIVLGAVDPDDGRMRSTSINGKAITYWLELTSAQKIDALGAAVRLIEQEEAETADEAVDGFTNPRVTYPDYKYARFT